MTMRKHKLGMKHDSGSGRSRTLKMRRIQAIQRYAKKYGKDFAWACWSLNIDFLTKAEIKHFNHGIKI